MVYDPEDDPALVHAWGCGMGRYRPDPLDSRYRYFEPLADHYLWWRYDTVTGEKAWVRQDTLEFSAGSGLDLRNRLEVTDEVHIAHNPALKMPDGI